VLVLDTAPSRRRIAYRLRASKRQVSFDSLTAGSFELASAIVRDYKHGVDILTLSDADVSKSGSATKARLLVERLRPKYRLILVDAGALSRGSAPHWLALSGNSVLVIDASTATREVLAYQRKQFEHDGVKFDGSILNRRTYPIPKALYWLVR
jgi:Mrp family chromosome partitioning ATPase